MPKPADLVIAGVGAVPVRRDPEAPLMDLAARAGRAAVADAGVDPREIDGLFLGVPALSGEPWMMWAANLGAHLGIPTRSLASYENGGLTALLALRAAADAITLGRVSAALVIASDARPLFDVAHFEAFARNAAYTQTALQGPVQGAYGVGAPIPYYAMSAQRYMHEFGVAAEAVAEVAVRLRAHAADHPLAQFREPLSVDEVLAAPVLSPPIHLPEAASVSTGACAVVVTDAARVPDSRRVRLAGWGEYHDPSHFIPARAPLTRFASMERAAADAFAAAGMTPGDVDVAEIYGVFAATELIAYEDLGFFDKGKAAGAVAEGRTTWGGEIVMNPTGGRLSFGHPAGATPLYEVAEVVRQLRGDAWGRQVEGATVGFVQAEHGMMNGTAVAIFERS